MRVGIMALAPLFSAMAAAAGDFAIIDKHVSATRADGIHADAVCDAGVMNSRIGGMGGQAISMVEPLCGVPFASCSGNEVDDPKTPPPACRSAANGIIGQ